MYVEVVRDNLFCEQDYNPQAIFLRLECLNVFMFTMNQWCDCTPAWFATCNIGLQISNETNLQIWNNQSKE